MKYYEPNAMSDDKRSIKYITNDPKDIDYKWDPIDGLLYMADSTSGKFDQATKENLPNLAVTINPIVKGLPDIIGCFLSSVTSPPPLVSNRLRRLFEKLSPGCFEYLPGPKIWDATFERSIDRNLYQFANLTRWIDSWDHDLTQIARLERSDGGYVSMISGDSVVDEKKVAGEQFWRDATTRDVFCSEEFKRRAESEGVVKFFFRLLKSN